MSVSGTKNVVISGSGVFTPSQIISNEELVASFNSYVDAENARNKEQIDNGELEPLVYSSTEFIEKASGIQQRYVLDKTGILDPALMAPRLRERSWDEPSQMAEMALEAAHKALMQAGRTADEIDGVICAASNHERAYPAIAVEIQDLLSVNGFAFDMNVACSSATFGIQAAADMIKSGSAKSILIINPEICSAHLEWRDRDCHFIFGDVCTAILLEASQSAISEFQFEILSTRLETKFSNNIRNDNGFLRRTREGHLEDRRDMLFQQEGKKVFREVVPMVAELIHSHMKQNNISPTDISRLWLHQANKSMNDLIAKKVFGRDATQKEQPNILQKYANTSSAGSVIAFSQYSDDLQPGEIGIICSFGAGYSAGSVIVRRKFTQATHG